MPSKGDDENEKKTAGMVEIRDLLKSEIDNFSNANTVLNDVSKKFNKIGLAYDKYDETISEADKKIQKLKKQEFYENLFIYIGFYFYLSCVGYVLLKRFPIHKIIFGFVSLIEIIISFILNFKSNYLNNTQDNYDNYTFIESIRTNGTYILNNLTKQIVNDNYNNSSINNYINNTINKTIIQDL